MLITNYGSVYTMSFTTKLHKQSTTRQWSNCTGCSYLKLYHLVLNTAKCTVRMTLDYLPLERARKRLNNCDATVILRWKANVLGIRDFEILWNLNTLEICGGFSAQNRAIIENFHFWHLHICNPKIDES